MAEWNRQSVPGLDSPRAMARGSNLARKLSDDVCIAVRSIFTDASFGCPDSDAGKNRQMTETGIDARNPSCHRREAEISRVGGENRANTRRARPSSRHHQATFIGICASVDLAVNRRCRNA